MNVIKLSLRKPSSYLYSLMILLVSRTNLFAQGAAPQQNAFSSFFPLIIIFVIFYFFLIRPQSVKAKEHQKMLNALKKDDKIITTGGIYAVITAVKGDAFEIKIAEGVKIQIAKSAVSSLAEPEQKILEEQVKAQQIK